MVTTNSTAHCIQVVLSPNRSIDWKDVKICLCILSLPALIIGIAWLVVGVWVILPFAVLELGLLAFFMYHICYQNYQQQRITIAKEQVTVESGVNAPSQALVFTRPDCYLAVNKPNKPIENLELALTSESQSLIIGDFLSPNDRELARRTLINAGLVECSSRWWEQH